MIILNNEDRIIFYLGNLDASNNVEFILEPLINHTNLNIHEHGYDNKLLNLLIKTNNTNKLFSYFKGDIQHMLGVKTLCKNRCEGNNNSVILRCLNFDRHWYYYYNKPYDIQFEQKQNIIFWRGATTGNIHKSNNNRFTFVEKWFNKNLNIDVGFSSICQDNDEYITYVKEECDINTFLKHKYLISIEGNDKDSGINWKLNSNSLVFMPKPRVSSWLMEITLIPDYHYILLKDDFSDLEEKFDWCNNNQDKCIQIVKNANVYMSQFNDNEKEEELEMHVINKYFELTNK
jgi:hypothetical protein